MAEYTELIKALRCCAENFGCPIECPRYSPADEGIRACVSRLEKDAAAAIEELDAEETRLLLITSELQDKVVELEEKLNDADIAADDNARQVEELQAETERLKAQLPKRGKWITHPEVKNIYGGVYIECPFCGEKYVVQNVSDEKFCRNCGADLRAKMEVQE